MAVRPITDVLRDLRYGEFLEELSDKFNKLVAAVDNNQKAGEITVKLKLKPSNAGTIEVTDDISVKAPVMAKGASLFFPTVEGNLVRNDPRQAEIPGLKEVAASPKQEVKVA
jgi:hypothetical protein